MNKFFTLLISVIFSLSANAQITPAPSVQPYGVIDTADLKMTGCDFEKDANAEVLFDVGTVNIGSYFDLVFERHIRTKIFNDNGKYMANVRLEYIGYENAEWITNLQAETINLTNGNIETTKVDKKSIFIQKIDKYFYSLTFTFPDVKPGSVIEFKYKYGGLPADNFPYWHFQGSLPTRYSEINAVIPNNYGFTNILHINQPYAKYESKDSQISKMALANVPSLSNEPFMTSREDNLQSVLFQLTSYFSTYSMAPQTISTWTKIGELIVKKYEDSGDLGRAIDREKEITDSAKRLNSADDKIAFVFNRVKNYLKWNGTDRAFINDGIPECWEKKSGNSTEINLIVYRLLNKAGVTAYPMLISTKNHGKINPAYPSTYQFNKTVTYIPIDSTHYYVLDATSKYNIYNVTPLDLLNSYGLCINKKDKKYTLIAIQNDLPVKQMVLINATISPAGKMDGTAQISRFNYNRIKDIKEYKTHGETKYLDYLSSKNNDLKISSLKFDNMAVDSLPLIQNISFNLSLSGSDDNYIYFKPNLFSSLDTNVFVNQKRNTDIDFGYRNNVTLIGNYKIPAGYKIDALPKSIKLDMPDKSISFKRVAFEQEGNITVQYILVYNQSIYLKENYESIFAFYKQMHEMLNEQIVLKKS